MTDAMRPRHWPLWALLVAHLSGDLAIACSELPGDSIWSPVDGYLIDAQIGLLAWWAVGTPGRPLLRYGGWALKMVWLTMLLSLCVFSTPNETHTPGGYYWIAQYQTAAFLAWEALLTGPLVLVAMAGVSVVLRFHGVPCVGRTNARGAASTSPGRKLIQFSLRDLLVFLTGLAVAFSLITALQPYPRWFLDFPGWWWRYAIPDGSIVLYIPVALEIAAVTFLAAWALCGMQRPAVTFATVPVLLATIVAATLLYLLFYISPLIETLAGYPTDWLREIQNVILHDVFTFTFLAASFLVCRLCGYCYIRPLKDEKRRKTDNEKGTSLIIEKAE